MAGAAERFDGIGFVFSADDPFAGIDLDDCMAGAELHRGARTLLEELPTYAEWSPSRHGVHVIAEAAKPAGGCVTKQTPWNGELAIYDRERFFTMTGDRLAGAPTTVEPLQAEFERLHGEYMRAADDPLERFPRLRAICERSCRPPPDASGSGWDHYLCCEGLRCGLSDYELEELVVRAHERHGEHKPRGYIRRTIDAARASERTGPNGTRRDDEDWQAGPAAEPFPLLSCDDLMELPDPRWLIKNVLPEGQAVIFGPPETYKSFIALDWAMRIAAGLPWAGHDVLQGHVIYVAAEGGGGLKWRVDAWREHHGDPDVSRAHFLTKRVNLLDREMVKRVKQTVASLDERVALLVVDTMARSMVGGDENSSKDVGRFIDALDDQDVLTRLVVHHAGREGLHERGSTALWGAADMMARAERDGHTPNAKLVCHKAPKDGETWPDVELRSLKVGRSLVLEQVPPLESALKADGERRAAIVTFLREHGPCTQNEIEAAVTGKAKAVRDTLHQLVAERRVERVEDGRGWSFSLPRPEDGDAVGTQS